MHWAVSQKLVTRLSGDDFSRCVSKIRVCCWKPGLPARMPLLEGSEGSADQLIQCGTVLEILLPSVLWGFLHFLDQALHRPALGTVVKFWGGGGNLALPTTPTSTVFRGRRRKNTMVKFDQLPRRQGHSRRS